MLGWAAGFLDGEGSFTYSRGIMVSAEQVDPEPLERLRDMFGGSIYRRGVRVHTTERDHQYNRRPTGTWYACGSRAAGIMMTLYPLLSRRRQETIERVLGEWRAAKHRTTLQHLTEEERRVRRNRLKCERYAERKAGRPPMRRGLRARMPA